LALAIFEAGQPSGQAASYAPGFRVDFVRDWKRAAARWNGAGHGTSFQHDQWLDAWYGAFNTVSPLIAIISDVITERQIALVPLISRVQRGIRIVEFADLGLTDFNAPILDFSAPGDAAGARMLCKALVGALRKLPEGVDLLRLQKMPADLVGKPNPLLALGRTGTCSLNGNLVEIGDDFELYRASTKRMQLARSWRVFNRYPGATFRLVAEKHEALALLDTMDAQQHERMTQLGIEFVLNDDCCARFYRDLVSRGVDTGFVVVSALVCDGAIVATTLGIRKGTNYVLLRTSNGGKPWSNCSPGLLIIERTMAALHQLGVRRFDLSIGNYLYKRRFGAAQFPLNDVTLALGWRGVPLMMRDRAAQWLRRYPRLKERISRALGKAPSREEY
jgi:CelD/BcsL family acetyltransferase involved in cellulose biosynthesis